MRLFVAVPVPENSFQAYQEARLALGQDIPGIRWVGRANYHLTLKFLGDVSDEGLPELREGLGCALKGSKSFSVELVGIGSFPSEKVPRVVWGGVRTGRENLEALAARVEKACVSLGFPQEERPFHPHLTLGRMKSFPRLKKTDLFDAWRETLFMSLSATEVFLMKSDLKPEGPLYSVVEKYPLEPIDGK